MNTKKMWLWGIIAVVVIFIISGINTIPSRDENVRAAWSQVENQYQRRMDLIPNLIETVKGYKDYERATLEAVVEARTKATQITLSPEALNDPKAVKVFEEAQGKLGSALSRLIAIAENYPDLKASQNFLSLQSQLEGTENRISVARKDYVEAVQSYNTYVRTFPGILWARILGASSKEIFAAKEGADTVPAVKF